VTGDVEGASCQLPVGGRWWWCCVSWVGGSRRGGHGPAHSWGLSWLWGCGVQFLWALVVLCWLLPLLCVVVVIIRWCCRHLLGGGSHLLGGCRHLAAGVVCSGEGCVTWHGDGVLKWWWLGVEE